MPTRTQKETMQIRLSKCLSWKTPMTSDQAKKSFITNGFVAEELYNVLGIKVADLESKNKMLNSLISELEDIVDSIPLINPYNTTTDGIFDSTMAVNRLRDLLARGVATKDCIKSVYPQKTE